MEQSTLNFIYFLAVIGGIFFVVNLGKLLWSLVKLLLPSKDFKQRYGQNTWAVITGGSDGIGLGFAQQLAKLGFNICIIARNRQKMQKVLKNLKKLNEHEFLTKCIVADFADCQKQGFFEYIEQQLKALEISFLINNVGISNIGYLHQIPRQRLFNQINVNTVPMVAMSHMLIPKMIARNKRAGIINISSISGSNPIPYISVYSATKAFNDYFSQSLEMQYSYKIDILSVKPLLVESALSKQQKSCTVASRNQCASASLKYLGIQYQTNGYIVHRILAFITDLLPKPLLRCISESESRKILQKQYEYEKVNNELNDSEVKK